MDLLGMIFGKKKKKIETQQDSDGFVVQISNTSLKSLGEPIVNPELNNTVLSVIDKVASAIASSRLVCESRDAQGKIGEIHNNLTSLLTIEPNSRMSAFDMWYKAIAICLLKNESWLWLVRDEDDEIIEIIPIYSKNEKLLTPKEAPNELYVKFTLTDGSTPVISERDLIHIRRLFITGEYFAEKNIPLQNQVSIDDAVWKNLVSWSNNSAIVRGALIANGVMKETDMKAAAEKFRQQFLSSENSGGVIVVDSKFTYKDINTPSQTLTADQVNQSKQNIYDYFGLNESIIRNTYDSSAWQAFYHGYLEPFYIRIEQELTRKLTTKRERGFDRRFRFVIDDMEHMSPTEKTAVLTFMTNIGAMSRDEVRAKWRMGTIPNGDIFLYSKNYAEVGKTAETSNTTNESEEGDKNAKGEN